MTPHDVATPQTEATMQEPEQPGASTPQDTGDGEPGGGNPFDFTTVEDAEAEGGGKPEAAEDGAEYKPDFGANFNEDDKTRAAVTQLARDAGLPADAAGKFVAGMCDMFKQQDMEKAKAEYDGLREDWGAKFEQNMVETGKYLKGMLMRGEIRAEDAGQLQNPAVYRLVQTMRSKLGEGKVAGASAQGTPTNSQTVLDDILNNPQNPMYKILANPRDPKYRETADQVNRMAGFRLY